MISTIFDQPISRWVWDEKYRYKKPDGTSDEKTPIDSLKRVVRGVYEKDSVDHAEAALDTMIEGSWVPAGRIHAGAGTGKRVTLINCYVSPNIEDSMETEIDHNSKGIFDALKVAGLTQQMGGGIGMNFDLRPRGAIVKRTGSVSSGNIHFMDMWHYMCSTIMSSGSRRGAMMGTMFCHHPDILEFIESKKELGRLTNFNISVLITDDFMEAVKNDDVWKLYYKVPPANGNYIESFIADGGCRQYVYNVIRARDLWDKIIRTTYEHWDPGVIFIDRINKKNNLYWLENIVATNPCGEQPLPPNGDCNLGAINLAVLVDNPFSDSARFNFSKLSKVASIGTRFLDNVLDVTLYPTEDQKKEALSKRRTGLGITGLANAFQQMKIVYGSKESVELTERIMETIRNSCYVTSIELAKERGPFPLFNRDRFLEAAFVKTLPENIRRSIYDHGIRNGVLMTIAPTGTTSLYYGNVSSGCEPVFDFSFDRKVRIEGETFQTFEVFDYGCQLYKNKFKSNKNKKLPSYFVRVADLTIDDHLVIQAACQKYVDASISKTINCPEDMTFEDFREVYMKAYDMGCKGCTTHKPSKTKASILTTKKEEKNKEVDSNSKELDDQGILNSEVEEEVYTHPIVPRPKKLFGATYKLRWPSNNHAFYVTINDYVDQSGQRRPFEIFVNSKSVENHEWVTALTRMISAIFRKGGDLSFLIEELTQVHSVGGGFIIDKKFTPSLVALIGRTIDKHLQETEVIGLQSFEASSEKQENEVAGLELGENDTNGEVCPNCHSPTLIMAEGCQKCTTCMYSNCG